MRLRASALLAPIVVFFAVIYLYPLAQLLATSVYDGGFTTKYYEAFFAEPTGLKVIGITARLAFSVTIITLLLAYPVAYILATRHGRLISILMVGVLIPFWISVLVRSYTWMMLLGWRGVINNLLIAVGLRREPMTLLYNALGVHVGMIYVLLPFMVLAIYASMRSFDPNLLRAAHSLGAGPVEAMLRVFVPMTLPGVGGGSVLVFLTAFGYFTTPALLGGASDITVAMMVQKQMSDLPSWGYGAATSSILLALVLGVFLICGKFLGRFQFTPGR
jgi:ABC-type spermidine/putrescine transport system permease subunit I